MANLFKLLYAPIYDTDGTTILSYKVTGVDYDGSLDSATAVDIPAKLDDDITVSVIGAGAFADTSRISVITFTNSIKSMETSVFDDCSGLLALQFAGTRAEWTALLANSSESWAYDFPANAKKYLIDNIDLSDLPTTAKMMKSTTGEDLISRYAVADVKGNQIDTTYMPRAEYSSLVEALHGKTKSYVVDTDAAGMGVFNTINQEVTVDKIIANIDDIATEIPASKLVVGDSLLIIQTTWPDRWVSSVIENPNGSGYLATFLPLESTKVDGITAVTEDTSKQVPVEDNPTKPRLERTYDVKLGDGATISSFTVLDGLKGEKGDKPTIAIGTVNKTVTPSAEIVPGDTTDYKLNLNLPKGDTGAMAELTTGTITTTGNDQPAEASITGSSTTGYKLNLSLPKGPAGDIRDIAIGTTSVSETPRVVGRDTSTTEKAQTTLDFYIPKGEKGTDGVGYGVSATCTAATGTEPAVAATVDETRKIVSFNFTLPTGSQGPKGDKGATGNGITLKANADACSSVGDAYFNNSNIVQLTAIDSSTGAKTFTDRGSASVMHDPTSEFRVEWDSTSQTLTIFTD